jgi:hypothetical protein
VEDSSLAAFEAGAGGLREMCESRPASTLWRASPFSLRARHLAHLWRSGI